ncbi:hypothetical protein Q5692_14590 [Microcoleus sp. C2C3]
MMLIINLAFGIWHLAFGIWHLGIGHWALGMGQTGHWEWGINLQLISSSL